MTTSPRLCLFVVVALGCANAISVSFLTAQETPSAPIATERIRQEAKDAPLALRFQGGTADECRAWQKEFASKLQTALGPVDPPKKWTVITVRKVEHEDHVFEDLLLEADGAPTLPLAVLTPKANAAAPNKKRPGILALHGHAPRGHLSVGDGDSGHTLVREGFVVVTPCFTPFGVRLGSPEAYGKQDPCGDTFIRLQLLGKLLIAENLRDSLWGLEYLCQHPAVDANRIGCAGLSYGGRMTMLTSALEPRIKIAVVSGALNVMQERIQGRYSCGAQVIPGLLKYGDVPEIGSLIAPRPAIWEAGLKDSLIKPDWAEDAMVRLRRAYQAFGANDELKIDRFDGGHVWSWQVALPQLKKVLQP